MNPCFSILVISLLVIAVVFLFLVSTEVPYIAKVGEYDRIGDRYYYVDKYTKKNWHGAWLSCRSKNGFLAWFENVDDLKAVAAVLKSKGINHIEGLWTSGSDLQEKKRFVWMANGGEIKADLWQPGEPNDKGEERCVHVRENVGKEFALNDVSCSKEIGFICQMDLQASEVVVERRNMFLQRFFQRVESPSR